MVMTPEETIEELSRHYRAIIELIGEDASREGLVKTPMRAAKALYYATSGYREDAKALMREAVFEHCGSQIVMVKDIEFYSFCRTPYFGRFLAKFLLDIFLTER